MILPFLGFSQVQYTIADVPVCWSVGGTDSSIVKFTIVTTQGAFLDLGYFDPTGTPVAVTGGTLKTGFCFDQTFSIDSTANRTFTITLGDQTVSWTDSVGTGTGGGGVSDLGSLTDVDTTGKADGYVLAYNSATSTWEAQDNTLSIDSTGQSFTIALGGQEIGFEDRVGAEYYAQLLDVDTAGVDTNYIAKYSPTAGGWKMYDNRINGLTDGYKDTNNNIFLFNPPFNEITGSDNAGILSLYRLKTGFENTGFGNYSGLLYTTGSQNDLFGFFASPQDTSGNRSTFLGSYTNMHPYLPIEAGTGKVKADESIFIGHRSRGLNDTSKYEITIGAFSIGKGDSTVTLGLPFYKGTYLNGILNLNGYGAGNKLPGLIGKTGSPYLALLATDGTITEIHKDSVGGGGGSTTLSGLTDVTLTSPQTGEVLIYNGTDWVNDTITISGGGVLSVTANNGLNNTGTASQPAIELGGTLTRATTTISANFKSLEINRPLNFMVDSVFLAKIQTQDGLSTSSYFSLGAASNSWRSVNNDDNLTNQIRLYSSSPTQGVEISSYQIANNNVFTQIELLPQEMQIVTPNVNTLTATAGQVLKLVNASTGEVEFASDSTGATALNDLTDVVLTSPQINDVLKYDGNNWVNGTDLVNDADADPTNELQDLSLSGTTLSLTNDATTVDLSGFLQNNLSGDVTITGNTNDYIYNNIDNFEINLSGTKTFYAGHAKMYINFDAIALKLFASDQPINLEAAQGIVFENHGTGTREAGDLGKTNSAYFARFATDGTIVESTALTSEVDGSITNEGSLSIGTGIAGSSVFMQSNTSGSTAVTISVGAGFDIAASGSTIFLNPEPFAIETGTSGAISWGSAPQRIHVLDFGANTSITLSFTNVAIGGIYTLRVTGNSGTDTLVWPGAAKFEDGTSAGTVTLQDGGQMFTFYWDGTNYWVK